MIKPLWNNAWVPGVEYKKAGSSNFYEEPGDKRDALRRVLSGGGA
jgi:hypothetical protein